MTTGSKQFVGKSKQQIFGVIKERILKRISGWGEKTLSMGGREILIKAVLQAIPTYLMSCFYLPGQSVNDIEAAIRNFWWGGVSQKRHMAWISWSQLCRPKQEGGMGFRDLCSFNLALLAKQGWRLISNPESLARRLFRARYYPNSSFLEAGAGSRPSAVWSSMLRARELLRKGLRIRIGNGFDTNIWSSPWIPDHEKAYVYTPQPTDRAFPLIVSDLINLETREWNKQLIDEVFWPVDCSRILAIPVGPISAKDRLVWQYSSNGIYSVKSAYQVLFASRRSEVVGDGGGTSGANGINWQEIWRLKLPPKVRLFIWRACKNILPHALELFRRRIAPSPLCFHCGKEPESLIHITMRCRGLEELWQRSPFGVEIPDILTTPWELIMRFRAVLDEEDFLCMLVIWWRIWLLRNRERHEELEDLPADLVSWARQFVRSYHEAQTQAQIVNEVPLPAIWKPPDPSIIKINVDVAIPNNSDFIRVAMVARDWQGVTKWWARKEIVGRPRPSE